ncbi:hypothetical protein P378_07210 [Desulforamulus profundi]|uniref:Uncharacterized protein n=1 Tax=Desulforamulus profundi TaxID=1383067 RepID=A0A2C6MGM9_9FIRM|nr:hypothetical protein P378_07210 [Desulforamulus profundi]
MEKMVFLPNTFLHKFIIKLLKSSRKKEKQREYN